MPFKRSSLLIPLCVTACGTVDTSRPAGRDAVVPDSVQVAVADSVVVLSRGAARATISLADSVNSSGGYRSKLLDQRRGSDGLLYLLVETTGLSRPSAPDGQCGAGDETDVTWLAVDSAMQPRKWQTVLVESCLQTRETVGESAGQSGGPWSVSFRIIGDSIRTASYDRRHPERGLRQTTVPDTTRR